MKVRFGTLNQKMFCFNQIITLSWCCFSKKYFGTVIKLFVFKLFVFQRFNRIIRFTGEICWKNECTFQLIRLSTFQQDYTMYRENLLKNECTFWHAQPDNVWF